MSNYITYTVLLALLISIVSGDTRIPGDFNYCDSSNNKDVINLDTICADTVNNVKTNLTESILQNRFYKLSNKLYKFSHNRRTANYHYFFSTLLFLMISLIFSYLLIKFIQCFIFN